MAAALVVLPAYYSSPTARDNYKGIAAWLRATANPATDLVILDAPGQADVWAIYNPGVPLLALPAERPADAAATEYALASAVADAENVYALFWATDEADPTGIVESWLNANLFAGAQSWQGNVRLAHFVHAPLLDCVPAQGALGAVKLTQFCTATRPPTVAQGEPLAVALAWQSSVPITQTLNTSVQLLDARNQVIAQHDGATGGAHASTVWQAGEEVVDRHALLIPAGTPPGTYRLIAALYDRATGARVVGGTGDALPLGEVTVAPATSQMPSALDTHAAARGSRPRPRDAAWLRPAQAGLWPCTRNAADRR